MSKLQLKKELALMSREEIVQVVLDAYTARKEVREYFDFFINPDIDKLTEKTLARIDREISRSKHGRSTARITVVRRAIKEYASYDPGPEYVGNLMLETIRRILIREKYIYFKETFEKGLRKLIDDTVAYADAHAMVDTTLARLSEFARDPNLATASFRNRLLLRFL